MLHRESRVLLKIARMGHSEMQRLLGTARIAHSEMPTLPKTARMARAETLTLPAMATTAHPGIRTLLNTVRMACAKMLVLAKIARMVPSKTLAPKGTAKRMTHLQNAKSSFECFNCGGGHLLYDCPKELDSARVAQKRREMARERDSGPKKMRYFEYEMQCQRFQPGKLSEELLDALDVRRNELPCFTYKMRVLGYPPGWLKDAEVEESGLEIYGLDDKNANDGEDEEVQYDPTRLISFPGFNVPMPEGVDDRWVDYEMAPMMQHQLRSEAEKYMNEQAAKRVDQRKKLPATAVRPSPAAVQAVDTNVEDDEIEEGQICGESSAENSPEIGSGSPGTTPVPDSVCTTPSMPLDTACTSSPMDVSPKPDTVENGDCASTEEPAAESPKVRLRKVTLGTPILLGFSEYTSLPPRENFAKGVSEFIPFENLPNTTGRYNKLRQVIDKVRAMRQEDKRQAGDQ
ncbi:hypothetical protein HPB48_007655 [Haemaphysalis longicornis]|uniref:PSP proline-rich domain-containing protein n=1 Tax=Haemaphysalis longicornis TaxID=44386 RepID=A0A9J6G596_HAELO|nr:hypothetical protein HPB48_007655 [Haemaphysalis longicornis]